MTRDPHEEAALRGLVEELEEQERRLVLPGLSHDDAWSLGCTLVDLGLERGLPITADVRRGRHQLFHAALEGTAPDNDVWVARKVAVVERFGASSYLVGRRLALRGEELDERVGVDPLHHAAHGGAFPLRVPGTGVVGVVTVSGLPQARDHALVVEALEAHLSRADG